MFLRQHNLQHNHLDSNDLTLFSLTIRGVMAKLLIWILSVIAITKQNCEGTNRTPFIQRHYCVFLGRVNVRTREHLIVSVFILLSTYSKKKTKLFHRLFEIMVSDSLYTDQLSLWSSAATYEIVHCGRTTLNYFLATKVYLGITLCFRFLYDKRSTANIMLLKV